MPNDEYFEARLYVRNQDTQPTWAGVTTELALEWTLVFLDYPPRFLGVIGMLATHDGYRKGRPARNSTWISKALRLSDIGVTPYMYALFRSHVSRKMKFSDWRDVMRQINAGQRISVICRNLELSAEKREHSS